MSEKTENLERRKRILEAAQDTFATEGFRNAEVTSIARRAGVGKATIYKHFESKDQILLTIVDENFKAIRDLALRHLIGAGHPLERFERTCLAIGEFLTENREFSKVLIREAGEFMPEIQRIHRAIVKQNLPFADAFFNALKEEHLLPDLPNQLMLEMLMNLSIGTIYTWTLSDGQDLRNEIVQLFTLWRTKASSFGFQPAQPPA
ncbi:Transcriptional regulator [gamma proteobacterium HdN1]|nr:Transcriptional regulator [gamma proteobacterium HdN1]